MLKPVQAFDVPAKTLKENSAVFGDQICTFSNKCIDQGNFPFVLKHANTTPAFK